MDSYKLFCRYPARGCERRDPQRVSGATLLMQRSVVRCGALTCGGLDGREDTKTGEYRKKQDEHCIHIIIGHTQRVHVIFIINGHCSPSVGGQ